MTRTAIVALAFSCLMGASCSSKTNEATIDSSSNETYRNSLVKIGIPLTSEDRQLLSEAITIIKIYSSGIAQLGPEENIRMKLSGLTNQQIIDKAKQLVLGWFYEKRNDEREFYKAVADAEKHIKLSKNERVYFQSTSGRKCRYTLELSNKSDYLTVQNAKVSIGNEKVVFTSILPGESKLIQGVCKVPSKFVVTSEIEMVRLTGLGLGLDVDVDVDLGIFRSFSNIYGPNIFHRFLYSLGLEHKPYKFIGNLPKPLPPKQ